MQLCLAKEKKNVALLSHFPPSSFTVAAFNNFYHLYKNTLTENGSAIAAAVIFFQEKPNKPLRKQLKNERPLSNVQFDNIDKTAMSTANAVHQDKGFEVPRII